MIDLQHSRSRRVRSGQRGPRLVAGVRATRAFEQKRGDEVAAGVWGLEDWWRCVLDWLGRESARGAVMSSGSTVRVNAAGRRRSPATMPGYLAGPAFHNKGMQYPPDPPGGDRAGDAPGRARPPRLRVRGLVAVLWRGGLRISEALALNETDIDIARGSLLIRHGKGDKSREAGMDQFGFEQLAAWMAHRVSLPVGPLFCVIDGPTRGRRWAATAARYELRSSRLRPASAVGSHPTSYATRTRSSSREK